MTEAEEHVILELAPKHIIGTNFRCQTIVLPYMGWGCSDESIGSELEALLFTSNEGIECYIGIEALWF